MSIKVKLIDSRDCWEPGETVRAEITWQGEDAAEELEAKLLWETRGSGDSEQGVVATEAFQTPGCNGNRRVEFTLPTAPWSYRGDLIEIAWLLDAVIWPSGEADQADLTLSPTGEELTPLAQDPNDPTLTDSEKKAQSLLENIKPWLEKFSRPRS